MRNVVMYGVEGNAQESTSMVSIGISSCNASSGVDHQCNSPFTPFSGFGLSAYPRFLNSSLAIRLLLQVNVTALNDVETSRFLFSDLLVHSACKIGLCQVSTLIFIYTANFFHASQVILHDIPAFSCRREQCIISTRNSSVGSSFFVGAISAQYQF